MDKVSVQTNRIDLLADVLLVPNHPNRKLLLLVIFIFSLISAPVNLLAEQFVRQSDFRPVGQFQAQQREKCGTENEESGKKQKRGKKARGGRRG